MAVYFIQSGDYIKIGKADNPQRRLKELQTGSPQRLKLLGVIPGGEIEERRLHAKYDHLRASGEWFRFSPEIIEISKQKAVDFDDDFVADNRVRGKLLSGWRLERNSNGYLRYRWQVKNGSGNPETYTTSTGNIGYRRGSKYLRVGRQQVGR